MTLSILKAQCWELWRMTRFELLVRLIAPLVYLWLSTLRPEFEGIVYFGIVFVSLFSVLWLNSHDQRGSRGGFPFTLGYSRPLPAFWLVAVPLVWLMVTNVALYLSLVGTARLLFHLPYPGLSMVPFLIVLTACLAVASWSTTSVWERILVTLMVLVVLWQWLGSRLFLLDPLRPEPATLREVFRFSDTEYALMASVTVASFGLCLYFIWKQRCGEYRSVFVWHRLFRKLGRINLERMDSFHTTRHAQIWFELRRTGLRALAVVLVGLFGMFFASWALWEANGVDVIASLWTFFCFMSLILMVLATEGVLGVKYRGQVPQLSVYEATQPVTVAGSILLKLGVIVGITLAGCGVLFIGALCSAMILDIDGVRKLTEFIREMRFFEVVLWLGIGAGLTLALAIMGTLLTMSVGYGMPAFEKYRIVTVSFTVFLVSPMLIPVAEKFSGLDLQIVSHAYLVFWGVFLMAVTLFSLHRTLQADIYGKKGLGMILSGWITLLVALFALALHAGADFSELNIYIMVFLAGLLCIPLASAAWAPLSFAALRNQ